MIRRHWWERLCPFQWADPRPEVQHIHECRYVVQEVGRHAHRCDCGQVYQERPG